MLTVAIQRGEKEGVVAKRAALSYYHRRYAIRWTQRRWLVVKQWEWMQRKRASLQNSPLPCSHGSEIVCGAIYGRCTMHDISHTRGQCNTTCEESEAEDNEIASMVPGLPTLRALCCDILNWGSHCTDCIMSNKVTRLVFVPSLRNNHPTFPSGALTNGRKKGSLHTLVQSKRKWFQLLWP